MRPKFISNFSFFLVVVFSLFSFYCIIKFNLVYAADGPPGDYYSTIANYLKLLKGEQLPTPAASGSAPGGSTTSPGQPNQSFVSLRQLFENVGPRAGVPPAILEAVMQIEWGRMFQLSEDKVKQLTEPGFIMPRCALPRPLSCPAEQCVINECSATGPMQMTIGVDNKGSASCSSCCWNGRCRTSCPNAWSTFGVGDPCSLYDNIYSAGRKLKNDTKNRCGSIAFDGEATSATNWTKSQVYRAICQYHGSCSFPAGRLRDGRNYCEHVWWWYHSQSSASQSGP